MRVVLDPNVLVSSLLSKGTTAAVLDAWIEDDRYTPIVCPLLLAELRGVLSRDKFNTITDEAKSGLVARLATEGEQADDPEIEPGVVLARNNHADFLVSGDPHLHQATVRDVTVLTPALFLQHIQSDSRTSEL